MTEKACFFCDVQLRDDSSRFLEGRFFFVRFDDFPVTEGHCEIIAKEHAGSYFGLSEEMVQDWYDLIGQAKKILEKRFHPDGFNVGVNEGEAAGSTQDHLHAHLIPRYQGDVPNPRGGVRNVIPSRGDYFAEASQNPEKEKYL